MAGWKVFYLYILVRHLDHRSGPLPKDFKRTTRFSLVSEPRSSPGIPVLELLLLYHNNSGRHCLTNSGYILHVRDLTNTRLDEGGG